MEGEAAREGWRRNRFFFFYWGAIENGGGEGEGGSRCGGGPVGSNRLFSSPTSSNIFLLQYLTSIFIHVHRAVNIIKKITNYTI